MSGPEDSRAVMKASIIANAIKAHGTTTDNDEAIRDAGREVGEGLVVVAGALNSIAEALNKLADAADHGEGHNF